MERLLTSFDRDVIEVWLIGMLSGGIPVRVGIDVLIRYRFWSRTKKRKQIINKKLFDVP